MPDADTKRQLVQLGITTDQCVASLIHAAAVDLLRTLPQSPEQIAAGRQLAMARRRKFAEATIARLDKNGDSILESEEYAATLPVFGQFDNQKTGITVEMYTQFLLNMWNEWPPAAASKQSTPAASPIQSASSGDTVKLPISNWDGKTLSEWITVLETDRSDKSIAEAIVAVKALAEPSQADQVWKALAPFAIDHGSYDHLRALLAKLYPGTSLVDHLFKEYEEYNIEHRAKLLQLMPMEDKNSVARVAEMLKLTQLVERVSEDQVESVGQLLERVMRHGSLDATALAYLHKVVAEQPKFGHAFMISRNPENPWHSPPSPFQQRVIMSAKEILLTPASSSIDVTRSAIILRKARIQLEQEEKSLISAINQRLLDLIGDEQRRSSLVTLRIQVGQPGLEPSWYLRERKKTATSSEIRLKPSEDFGNELHELLQLVNESKRVAELKTGVRSIVEAYERTVMKIEELRFCNSKVAIEIDGQQMISGSTNNTADVQKVTSQEWLALLNYDLAAVCLNRIGFPVSEAQTRRQAALERRQRFAETTIARLDKNGDSVLQSEEYLPTLPGFAGLDSDKTGITTDTYSEYLLSVSGESFTGDSLPDPSVSERNRKFAEMIVKRYDKNVNGFIDGDEFNASVTDIRPADENNDGKISATEYANFLHTWQQQQKRP